MKIALASQNRHSITPHAGKCRHFFVVDTCQGGTPTSITLEPSQVLHVWQENNPHPLDGVDVLIAGSAGSGVAEKLKMHGIHVVATSERNPQHAVAQLLNGSLPVIAIRTQTDTKSRPGICFLANRNT